MFPAAVENVLLNKWSSVWLWVYEASAGSQTITYRKLQALKTGQREPTVLISIVLKAKGEKMNVGKGILSH